MNLAFRPTTYFEDAFKALLSTIKGERRKREVLDRINSGDIAELEGWIVKGTLEDDERESLGRIHPAFMGGEYLPDYLPGEVEIARIALESTTADVISIRARLSGGKLRYRIVNEYETEYVAQPAESDLPLTFGEVIAMIEGPQGDDLPCAPAAFWNEQYECGTTPDEIATFVTVSSEYYPDITEYYEDRFEQWLEEQNDRSAVRHENPNQLELDL
jgi:hypothetical protein